MTEIIKYVVGIIIAIIAFRLLSAALGAVFGSFAGLIVVAIIGWLIWRTIARGRAA